MSFLSCIGKKSKKKKAGKHEPIDHRLSEASQAPKDGVEELPEKELLIQNESKTSGSKVGTSSPNGKHKDTSNDTLQKQLEALQMENKLYKQQIDKQEKTMTSQIEQIRQLENNNLELKTRTTKAESEAAKISVDNQRLLQKIVGMEENQAMMSRAELQSMISQLEEVEQRSNANTHPEQRSKELSGIRTNPGDLFRKKTPLTQEDKQLCWRLCRTEARLSQSMDENRQLREDLKDMLDSHTELQKLIVSDTIHELESETMPRSSSAHARLSTSLDDKTNDSDRTKELLNRLKDAEIDNAKLSKDYLDLKASYESLQKRIYAVEEKQFDKILEFDDDIEQTEPEIDKETEQKTEVCESIIETVNVVNETERKVQTEKVSGAMVEVGTQTESEIPNNSSDEVRELEDEIRDDNAINELIKKLEKQERETNAWRLENNVLEKVCESLAARVDNLSKDYLGTKEANDQLTKQVKDQINEINKREKEIENLRNDNNKANGETKRLQDENKRLSQQLQKRKDTSSKTSTNVENIERELTDIKQKYEEANRRLKEYAGIKPTQANKSLDLNTLTPATLAERFRTELYDQQWKQAYKILTGKLKKDDKKAVQILAEICTEAYLFCKRAGRMQMDAIMTALVTPTAHPYRSGQTNKRNGLSKALLDQLPEDLKRRLAHFRCRPSQNMITTGVHDFLNQIDYDRTRFLRHVSERDFNEMMSYIITCFELSWCMAAQDPPMYLLFKVKYGHDIDEDIFEAYREPGKRVDYIVWPAVFTEEGGTCLQKGVAYALPEKS